MPEPAKAAKEASEINTNEELYLTGLHIEQYRHATYLPDPYYCEGLKRDPGDIRINNAYGSLMMRRGKLAEAEQHFRKALTHRKLGRTEAANARFYRLLDYGEQHLKEVVKIDYFAVSLPDFLIFEEDYTLRNRAHCYYLMALVNIGLGEDQKAKEFFDRAAALEPCQMMCRVYTQLL